MPPAPPDHYATLGLDRRCTDAQIRAAYRVLAKQHHPDVNPGSHDALSRTQALNAAYEILSDPVRRQAYDSELSAPKMAPAPKPSGPAAANLAQDVYLRLEEFLQGARLEVRVTDAGNPNGAETYELIVPPDTAPGTCFKLPRAGLPGRSFVRVRVKARPDFRFKVRGSDLRCDLKISTRRAEQGGMEMLRSLTGSMLRVPIPRNVKRNEIIRLGGEGLPRPRGGRGDLLVRITYRPEVRISRAPAR